MLGGDVTIYFVRHGETDWNADQRYQGQRDIHLNDRGRAQARRNGATLADVLGLRAASLDYVSSPLRRACETMEIMRGELSLPPNDYRTDERLLEVHYGHWEGQLLTDLPALDPEGVAARQADYWNWQPKDGESYRMLSERVALWLKDVTRDTVVASHGGVSRVLRGLLLQLPYADIPQLEVPQDRILVLKAGTSGWL
jgi:broad specificity phosphatase PhoE